MPVLIPYTWRLVATPDVLRSDCDLLTEQQTVVSRALTQQEVILKVNPVADITALRDWLDDHARKQFRIFGVFVYIVTDCLWRYDAVMFSFDDLNIAVYFKLYWYNTMNSEGLTL